MKQGQFPAILPLASLNGQNGFKIDGEGGNSGISVSTAGDINGDGYADILIGANGYASSTGRSYVVFGGLNVGSVGTIPLSSLNGANGFKLDGETSNDYSGYTVSAVGDINGDGHADLLIGANGYPSGSLRGRSYVVFGGAGIGSSGLFSLSSLNGTNGFKLDGENNGDFTQYTGDFVSAAGDINGDGYADLLIGANGYPGGSKKGRSYVVFGGLGVGKSGDIALSSLNGANGFKLDGENNGDQSGYFVSAAGDINGDGHNDVVIGAWEYPSTSYKGRSYVVFGGPGVGKSGDLLLSSLNGSNGFKLDGENNNDQSGFSVSAAGDINGDGYNDVVIGATGYPSGSAKGRSYVVFGGPGVGSSGLISLSSLNGTTGFKLDNENNGDCQNNIFVSTAGDINGDSYVDLLIGASSYLGGSNKGRSYVVFGGPGVGSSGKGLFNLFSLTGANGFKLDSENSGDWGGYSVSAAGDINGDGISDLIIGAPAYSSWNGRSYVVFGDAPPVLVNNSLYVWPGGKIVVYPSNLGAYDRNHNNNSLVFIPAALKHGYFSTLSAPATPLVNFTQSQISSGTIQFVHDGTGSAPSYNITIRSAGIAWTGPLSANITFGPPTTTGSPVPTTTASQTPTTPTPSVKSTSTPSTMQTTTPAVTSTLAPTATPTTITVSTQTPTVTSISTPSTSQTPTPAMTTTTTPTTIPTPSPSSFSPVLLTNQLALSNGQTVVLSGNNLQASEAGFNNSRLIFSVGGVQNGYFATVSSSNGAAKNLTSFTQAQIQNGAVEFVHIGNGQAPSYSILVSDGVQSTLPSSAVINFAGAPIITQNKLNITTGGTITLTPALLNVTVTDGSAPGQVVLTVSNLQHATITSNVTKMPVNNFTLAQLQASQIQLTQDGSLITPSYTITAHGTQTSSAPNQALVYFSNQGVYAPQLVNNYLQVTQGKETVLSNQYLSAQQPPSGQALDNHTMFYVNNIEYGHFSLTQQPQTWITSFSEQQLLDGQVQFVQDGSAATPGYQTEAEVLGLQSASLPASIFFTPNNQSPPIVSASGDSGYTTIQKAIIGAAVSGTVGIFFAVLQGCLKRAANKKLLQALGEGTDEYDLTVVRPVAKEIARQIKITGFMSSTTNTEMAHFKSAVRTILFELDKRAVDLNFADMKLAKRDGLINEIARQTRRIVLNDKGCCRELTSFFRAQATPDDIEKAAPEIAAAVVQSLSVNLRSASSGALSMELPELSGSKNILLSASSSSQVPPASPSSVEPLRQERESSQILGS